jgi:hypothetical protein
MATSLKSLTGIGADARKLARLLQAKAPKGHMLAYINPREAALLKAHGGSGKPEPDTGIPSFDDGEDYGSIAAGGGDVYGPETSTSAAQNAAADLVTPYTSTGAYPVEAGYTQAPAAPGATSGAAGADLQLSSFPEARPVQGFDTARTTDAETARLMGGAGTPEEKSLLKQASEKTGLKEDTLARLGIAGVTGLLGARAARAAEKSGQAGAQQIQALATPYQQQGAELQAQARRGELTPQAMQSLQAAQAQAAQGVERRGGVGAAQATAQIEQLRQQLLQQQYDYGLKLSGIGDNIALGAIKTGMEADRYVQGLNNSFYQNMAYIAAGMTPGAPRG